jgi:hypothetical protein
MAHFAQVDLDGVVTQVIVAEQDFIDSGAVGDPSTWIQTSYNTRGGHHPEGRPLRKNYAGIGYSYDPVLDAFIPPKPFGSWVLDKNTCFWESPVPYPADSNCYEWDEATTSWVQVI